ncbi:MAG: AcrB/AcrD/AcrF family protein [Sphingomonadaceae bacterium]
MNEKTPNRRLSEVNWRWWWLIAWACFAVWLIVWKWAAIHWFALGDTDDNMRMSQVRALIHGQNWYDLRQYKLNPPDGFNVHWSRLVDMPIAGTILLTRPLFGGIMAEKIAVTAAPLLALGVALYALMLIAQRLIDRHAWIVAIPILAAAQVSLNMWAPLRIDHHGWQLAFLLWVIAGSADRDRLRGGLTTGLATALSLVIGLEMLPYLALAGIMTVLAWVRDDAAAPRLRGYGLALAGGCAVGYALFASNDNRAYVCDAFSPVYLSAMLTAGGLAVLLSVSPLSNRTARLGAAGVAGVALAIAFALVWPDCLGQPERISPELEQRWFQYINEAKPMWSHGYKRFVPVLAPAIIGTAGSLAALWYSRREERVMSWATAAALSLTATLLLFWQTRAGAAAQLLAVPGAAWLGWWALRYTINHRAMPMRVFGTVAAFALISGLAASALVQAIPEKPRSAARKQVSAANRKCPTMPALAPIARMPEATILTFVDLGPRLITVTHHKAIAGPYHRNGDAILDVQHSFRSEDPEVAHDVMNRHGATLLLLCPGLSESTIYATQDPEGFYRQLVRGKIPAWLERVPLPEGSPFMLWRKVG